MSRLLEAPRACSDLSDPSEGLRVSLNSRQLANRCDRDPEPPVTAAKAKVGVSRIRRQPQLVVQLPPLGKSFN